jgi:DNA-binding MarR family transcriptional regulator
MTPTPSDPRPRPSATAPTTGPTAGSTAPAGAGQAMLDAAIGFRLGRAYRTVRAGWEARIADLPLTGPQAGALRAVSERPGIGLRQLARRLGTDPMNAKRLADGLEAAGLLTSCHDPADRRRRVLDPTDRGVALSRELQQRSGEWTRTVESIVGPEDTARLWRILERLEAGIAALAASDTDAGTGPDRGSSRG